MGQAERESGAGRRLADTTTEKPFSALLDGIRQQDEARRRITDAYRLPEPACLPSLIDDAGLPEDVKTKARLIAGQICQRLRDGAPVGGVQALVQEFDLSTSEGVSLMCLAEALLRIPDAATRDALIRDRLADGEWLAHSGGRRPAFVNAAAVGLALCGGSLAIPAARPLVRRAMAAGMKIMGSQFVTGRTIDQALARSRRLEAKGFGYSYDLLGETATTAEDSAAYVSGYEHAIRAIGKASAGRGLYDGPGISIKLSALHPRYSRSQRDRVMAELYGRLRDLCVLARGVDIGVTIDAEEAERLDLSLDLMDMLCHEPALAGWNGIGMVVQAYQKRARFVIDFLIGLARESGHRLMIRLCKGAYWDSEIKRAQQEGLEDFPVYTRKVYTDVSYIACAKRLLAAPDAVFPQFATHNALTMATILAMAESGFRVGQYEFQGLHGMGEALYSEVVGPARLNRPCRLYAPVGTPETLLAYLVRRLLENGANASFVNRIGDPAISLDDLLADPVRVARDMEQVGRPHEKVPPPVRLFGPSRANSRGIDWSNERHLGQLAAGLAASAGMPRRARPMLAAGSAEGVARPSLNPADHDDMVGTVIEATPDLVTRAVRAAETSAWPRWTPAQRAECLVKAARLMEERHVELLELVVREAGKSLPNAVAELREAVDFLRYYAAQAENAFGLDTHRPLGPIACISPWNFPLAIFTGQIAAALVAGNPVLAKPAEETPLIAAQAVELFREAGIPADALQLLPGDGVIGQALVADPAIAGVMFTGSTEVAKLIQRQLANRLSVAGQPIPLVAETGGQNAMVVDSSALPEQVVADVLQSAFDSAGQRCSALRLLCLQEDVAGKILHLLKGAMAELSVGRPDRLSTDVGPIITREAAERIRDYVAEAKRAGRPVHSLPLTDDTRRGSFVPPTLIEIDTVEDLGGEIFGPVLHVLTFRASGIDRLVDAINASGFGLTFGLHSRIPSTIERIAGRIGAGNVYVNRNMIGAVVGVQPFGGHGLSGTGPKAGGPLYLWRLLSAAPPPALPGKPPEERLAPARHFSHWLDGKGLSAAARQVADMVAASPLRTPVELPGPVGECNIYEVGPRGRVFCHAADEGDLVLQVGAALATGNLAVIAKSGGPAALLRDLPDALARRVEWAEAGEDLPDCQAVLLAGDETATLRFADRIARSSGPIIPLIVKKDEVSAPGEAYPLWQLVAERSLSTNTAASGNTSLAAIG